MTSVVHVVEATFAGIGRHVLDLADAQRSEGLDVTVVWSHDRSSSIFRDRLEDSALAAVEVSMTRHPSPANLRAIHAVHSLLERNDVDIVHGHGAGGGQVARLASVRRRAASVYTPNAYRSMQDSGSTLVGTVSAWVERALSPLTAATINVSVEEAVFARSKRLIRGRSVVIENGVVPPTGSPAAKVVEFVASGSEPVVGFVGRLSEQKRPEAAVTAVAEHNRRSGPRSRLCMIGEGERIESVSAAITGHDVDAIVLTSDRGAASMQLFDVLLVTSGYEGFPYVVLEALDAGVPVVVSPAVPIAAFGSDPAGIVVSRGWDAADNAEALERALSAPWTTDEIRATAAPYTVSRMTNKTNDLYNELLVT